MSIGFPLTLLFVGKLFDAGIIPECHRYGLESQNYCRYSSGYRNNFDVSYGFQSQSGQPYLRLTEAYLMYAPGCTGCFSPHACFSRRIMPDSIGRPTIKRHASTKKRKLCNKPLTLLFYCKPLTVLFYCKPLTVLFYCKPLTVLFYCKPLTVLFYCKRHASTKKKRKLCNKPLSLLFYCKPLTVLF